MPTNWSHNSLPLRQTITKVINIQKALPKSIFASFIVLANRNTECFREKMSESHIIDDKLLPCDQFENKLMTLRYFPNSLNMIPMETLSCK